MDRFITDKSKQLNDINQILKMQALLEQYDRQNAYLNYQTQQLLIQNETLKQANILSYKNSLIIQDDILQIKNRKTKLLGSGQKKFNDLNKYRKNKYEYLFNQGQLKDFKNSIKNQIKKQANKKTQTKQVQTQTTTQNISHKNGSNININEQRYTAGKQTQNSFSAKDIGLSQSKEKQTVVTWKDRQISPQQRKGIDSNSISRFYIQQQKKTSQTKQKAISKQKSISRQKYQGQSIKYSKDAYLKQSDHLEQTFGHKSLHKITTIMDSDMSSGIKKYTDQSRISQKFYPLAMESKQLGIVHQEIKHMGTASQQLGTPFKQSKQLRTTFQNSQKIYQVGSFPLVRSQSKEKFNHMLNPSPKIQLKNIILGGQINPFILKTQKTLNQISIQMHRNPSEKIKRKYIKIISNKKIPQNSQQSKQSKQLSPKNNKNN